AARGRALVVDRSLPALIAVDLDSGDRAVVSAPALGEGPRFTDPRAVLLDDSGSGALVLDEDLDAVMLVDLGCDRPALVCGDRVALSR
uniref:hypothetical protein n=1 Tax=Haliangium sp. TaxID=2663208 RepID=UPI003D0DE51D